MDLASVTIELKQGSWEWHLARCGKATASRMHDVTHKLKNGNWSAARENYIAELISERLSGVPYPHKKTVEMQWGTDNETDARELYALSCPESVTEVGFVLHPNIEMTGSSPDGFVGDVGLLQIKCPNTATHLKTLRGASIDIEYVKQMQWEMATTQRLFCDFVSYDPRVPTEICMVTNRVYRDDEMIAQLESDVIQFLIEVDSEVIKLCERYKLQVVA
jgi:YqaJ-like viral recombinase domain